MCGTKKNRKHFQKDLADEVLEKGTASFLYHTDGHPMLTWRYRSIKDKAAGGQRLATCFDMSISCDGTNREG